MGKPKFHPWNEDGNGKIRLDLNNWMPYSWKRQMEEFRRLYWEHIWYSKSIEVSMHELTDKGATYKTLSALNYDREKEQSMIGRSRDFLTNLKIDEVKSSREMIGLMNAAERQLKIESDYEEKLEEYIYKPSFNPPTFDMYELRTKIQHLKQHYLLRLVPFV